MAYLNRFERWLADHGVSQETERYTRSGGETTATRLTPAGVVRATVLVIHGTGNDRFYPFLSLFKALLSRGLAVYTIDLDGHGATSTTVLASASVRSAIEDAVSHARATPAGVPVQVLGHSLGGVLALDALTRLGDIVNAAVIISAPIERLKAPRLWREVLSFARPSFYTQIPVYGPYGILPAAGFFKRASFPIRIHHTRQSHLDYVETVNSLIAQIAPLRAAAACKTPTLFVSGDQDIIAPPAVARQLQAQVNRNKPGCASLVILPRETHLTTLMSRAAQQQIADWLLAQAQTSKGEVR